VQQLLSAVEVSQILKNIAEQYIHSLKINIFAPEFSGHPKRKRSSSNHPILQVLCLFQGGVIHTQTYPNIKQKSTPVTAKELSLDRRPSETKGSISRKNTIPNPLFIGPIPQNGMACGKKACSALSS